jgi:hypothetical protein
MLYKVSSNSKDTMKPYEIDTKTEQGKNLVSILMHPKNLVRFKNFGIAAHFIKHFLKKVRFL